MSDVFGVSRLPLPTAAEAAAVDECARTRFGIPDRVLMESAGRAAALVLARLYPVGRVVGVAGSGHNGGDLLVMMRTLRAWGRDVRVIGVGSRAPDQSLLHGGDLHITDGVEAATLAEAAVVVDGMLGTGAEGAPRGAVAEWIRRLNDGGVPIVALDLPSGVDGTTGTIAGDAVRAHVTVTFGAPKLGMMLYPGRAHCGRIIGVEVGFPPGCLEAGAHLITGDWVRAHMRGREPTAHKGTAGRLLVLAGHDGMAGAAAIAAEAAGRAGAGLLRIASAASNRVVLQMLVPEATFLDRDHLGEDVLGQMHALVAGPGLGTDDAARAALMRALELMAGRPTLLDADALNLLADEPGMLSDVASRGPVVITPHARELARLRDGPLDDVLADMPSAARAAARSFGCTVLLKGQPSLIARPDGSLCVTSVGSSDLATAGSGDQLAGTIGAFLAGGYNPHVAAALGLHLSGRAADLAALGPALTASAVTAHLAAALADPGPAASPLALPFVTLDQPPRH